VLEQVVQLIGVGRVVLAGGIGQPFEPS